MQVNIKKTHPDAVIPTYATDGAACFDLHAATVDYSGWGPKSFNDTFDTGLSFEIPDGHVMLVFSRSGHGFKHGATLINSVGVIDSDYRGSVIVKMTGTVPSKPGDRIAQAMILPISQVSFNVVEELSATERGDGGFGSTGN